MPRLEPVAGHRNSHGHYLVLVDELAEIAVVFVDENDSPPHAPSGPGGSGIQCVTSHIEIIPCHFHFGFLCR